MIRRIIGAICAAVVPILTLAPHWAFAQVPIEEGTSRRISTCRYIVAFPHYSDQLRDGAKRVIDEAAERARANGNHLISVNPHWQPDEKPELAAKRFEAIQKELDRVKDPDDRIEKASIAHAPPTRAEAYINVCGPIENAQYSTIAPPTDLDYRVELQVDSVRMAIPLRYLGPGYWRDTPLEPMYLGDQGQMMFFGPELQDATSKSARRCREGDTHGLHCDELILVYVQGLNVRPFEGPRQPPSSQSDGYIEVAGTVYGAKFFIKRTDLPQQGGYFEAKTSQGELLLGSCTWGAPARSPDVPSAEQIMAAMERGDASTCRITNLHIGALDAKATFNGHLFREWRTIEASLSHLIAGFEEPTK